MAPAVKYTFGPFALDPVSRRLTRDGEPVGLSDRQLAVLLALVAGAGAVLSKDTLIETAWQDVAVGDNSLEQVISRLRRLLGATPDGRPYIETVPRRGYRFDARVERSAARQSVASLDVLMQPHRAFVEGRAALETLRLDAVEQAREVFAQVVEAVPDHAPGHVGLATALVLAFEATRALEVPDIDALRVALAHAQEACRLDASSGEAWATLGVVLSRTGASADAIAAARRAVSLDPDNWRHAVRLAWVSWGEERLSAAHQALRLLPGVGLAHWLAATVYVARQAFEAAERELAVARDSQAHAPDGDRFGVAGLHLLSGLIRLALDDDAVALEAFDRELALEHAGHLHSHEACANARYAVGAVQLRRGDEQEAVTTFRQALAAQAGHPWALAALAALDPEAREVAAGRLDRRVDALRARGAGVEAAMIGGLASSLAGRPDEAASRVHAALVAAPPGSSGWTLPVEPLLHVSRQRDPWMPVLAALRSRAA